MPSSKPSQHVTQIHDALAEAVAALQALLKAPLLVDQDADEREEEALDVRAIGPVDERG